GSCPAPARPQPRDLTGASTDAAATLARRKDKGAVREEWTEQGRRLFLHALSGWSPYLFCDCQVVIRRDRGVILKSPVERVNAARPRESRVHIILREKQRRSG